MAKRPKRPAPQARPRAARREADRQAEKHRALARKVAALEIGGAPDRPLPIPSASVVEGEAAGSRCPACGGEARVLEHEVTEHQGARLRVARLVCKSCREAWSRYYRIALAN